MASLLHTRTFNRADRAVEGWYWALTSRELRRGQQPLDGRQMAQKTRL